jgi:hypothetical protein
MEMTENILLKFMPVKLSKYRMIKMKNKGFALFELIIVIALIFVSLLYCRGCTNSKTATRILTQTGHTQIQINPSPIWFACGSDDIFHTGFHAISPSGQAVEGCVCEGLFFKQSTIRYK